MIIRKNIHEIENYKVDRKYILNTSMLEGYREVYKYNKIEIRNNFTGSVLIVESDNVHVDVERLIYFATKDLPHSKIIIDSARENINTLYINVLPLLTTA